MPATCACGERFSLEHALTCRHGGYIVMCHDEVRDLFAALLSETCYNVTTEPELHRSTERPSARAVQISQTAPAWTSRLEASGVAVNIF